MTMPLTVSEATLQDAIFKYALPRGWWVTHFRPAQTARGWRTPIEGMPGFPDLAMARNGEVIVAEVKSQQGRATPGQKLWLHELGEHGRLWKPSDWPEIQEELR